MGQCQCLSFLNCKSMYHSLGDFCCSCCRLVLGPDQSLLPCSSAHDLISSSRSLVLSRKEPSGCVWVMHDGMDLISFFFPPLAFCLLFGSWRWVSLSKYHRVCVEMDSKRPFLSCPVPRWPSMVGRDPSFFLPSLPFFPSPLISQALALIQLFFFFVLFPRVEICSVSFSFSIFGCVVSASFDKLLAKVGDGAVVTRTDTET